MTPEPAQNGHCDLPGALSSASVPDDHEAFWADLGRPADAYPLVSGASYAVQQGCKSSEGVQDG